MGNGNMVHERLLSQTLGTNNKSSPDRSISEAKLRILPLAESSMSLQLRHNICRVSWKDICYNLVVADNDGFPRHGTEIFFSKFLNNIKALDKPCKIISILGTAARSGGTSPNILMLKMIKPILSVEDESISTKRFLRSLGRAHARLGVERAEFDIFNVAFLKTLASYPQIMDHSVTIEAWKSLLFFIADQLAFDKIIFKDHYTACDDNTTNCTRPQTGQSS